MSLSEQEILRFLMHSSERIPAAADTAIAVAACTVVAVFFGLNLKRPVTAGKILSSEMAGWQSEPPTLEGAEFGPGRYVLQTGLATLGFHSGVNMVLEGPAKIEVISDMEVNFNSGNASFEVPERATGFQVNTRFGQVVDHGTRKVRSGVNRRALLAFDVSAIDVDQVADARLILNAVPTGLGMATDMPRVSNFGVYGIPDDERENWPNSGLLWEDAPKLDEARQLATYSLERARQRTVIKLRTPELLAFIQADQSGEVGFILHCLTPGTTLVHGFASSQHREAAGPVLELLMKK